MKVLITGATGFIGRRLYKFLNNEGYSIRVVSRRDNLTFKDTVVCDLLKEKLPSSAFRDVEKIFHLAGYTHDLSNPKNKESLYRSINVNSSVGIAKMAIEAGVKQFVFVSSTKAGTKNINFDTVHLEEEPEGIYGKTKREAEIKLGNLVKGTKMRLDIIRPALVYGPNVKGNLALMIKGIKRGWFPPLPEVNNRRSMIHVDDLINAIIFISTTPDDSEEIYIATDGKTYSSREIYETLCNVLGKKIPKWRVPYFCFQIVSKLHPSFKYKVEKLMGDEYYSSLSIESLGFRPKFTLNDINEKIF